MLYNPDDLNTIIKNGKKKKVENTDEDSIAYNNIEIEKEKESAHIIECPQCEMKVFYSGNFKDFECPSCEFNKKD